MAAIAKDRPAEAVVCVALAAVFACIPPILGSGLTKLSLNAPLVAGAVLAVAAVIVVFVTVGFVAALIAAVVASLLLGALFVLGQRSRALVRA